MPSIYSSARTELAKLLIYGLFRKIRVLAQDGIVGITPRKLDNHLAYAMRVDESLTFEAYWSDRRFRSKRPRWRKGAPIVDKCGDNCYAPIGDGDFRQLRSQHWDHKNDREDKRGMAHDLNGERVLVALLHRSWLSAKSTYGGGRGNVRP